ncbi:uncharacterized protein [Vicugna pacos]|uniref:Translation initiation factor IF-2-like n=1 Tax=Vicugna pacos TaxID=30538 RepID=A0ABM5CRE1_VICPA
MAASGSPGPTPSPCRRKPAEPRRRRPLAVGEEEMNLPPDGPVGGGCRRGQRGESRGPSRSRRGGGYRSALRPIVSLPRGSRRSRAREPGSSPARHLLPPLWKRPPPPRAARPGPRLRAANRRRCGRGHRHLGAARAAPSRRHVRAVPAFPAAAGARWPAGRVRAQLSGGPAPRRAGGGRARAGPERQPLAQGFEALPGQTGFS